MLETLQSPFPTGRAEPRAPLRAVQPLRTEWRGVQDLAGLVPAWRDLTERAIEPNVFFEPDALLPALRHLAEARRVQVLLVWRGERLMALLPLTLSRLPFTPGEARIWTPPLIPFGVPPVDRAEADAVLDQVFAALGAPTLRVVGLVATLITVDGAFAGALRARAARAGQRLETLQPHRRAILPGAGAADEEGVRGKTLKELRRLRRRLGEEGEVTVEHARTPAAVRDAVEDFLRLEASGWKGRRGTALVQDAGDATYLRTMTRQLARLNRCRIDLFKVGGRPIAAGIVLRSGSRAWFWKIAVDEAYARFSPGVHMTMAVTEAQRAARGLDFTDSCAVQDHPMIDHLWRERTTVADYIVAVTPRRVAATAALIARETAHREVRGFAKRTFRRFFAAQR